MSTSNSTVAPREASSDKLAVAAAAGGLFATVATGAACVGPLVAILLGVSGFGWLTQYSYLRVPASILTGACLLFGFYWVYLRPKRNPCCAAKAKSQKLAKIVLWTACAFAVAINTFEYVIFPRLG